LGHPGQKYARDADRPVWRKSVHFGRLRDICPRQSGIAGPKVCRGREPTDSPKTGDFHPGQLGQKDAEDAKIRKSRERMESRH
ncbi:hypothetical protein KI387_034048, partial [Taxus chinensis]